MQTENLRISISFESDYSDEDIKDFPGNWNDEDIFIEEVASDVVYEHFTKAWRNLYPLIEGKTINSICIGIDILGLNNGLARYCHEDSDNEEGNYGFAVGPYILYEYFKKYWDNTYIMDTITDFVWEHEILHMLDHNNIIEYRYHFYSNDVRELLVKHLLRFRNEGIAELFYILRNQGSIKTIEAARIKFKENFDTIVTLPWKEINKINQIKEYIDNNSLYYTIGPWLILHAIYINSDKEGRNLVRKMAEHIKNGSEAEMTDIMLIIKLALTIDNYTFIKSITEPAEDGIAFIEKEHITSLAQKLNTIKHKRIIPDSDSEYNIENAKLVNLFNYFL